jgi:hypothetical protein
VPGRDCYLVCHSALVPLREIGVRIKRECPLLDFGGALSSLPETGSGETDRVIVERGDFGRGGNGRHELCYAQARWRFA